MFGQYRNGLADESFDAHQVARFGGLAESKGLPFPPSSGSTTDSVDVGFRFLGQIVVEEVRDAVHIDATTGDVGGHKDGNVA